MSAPCGTPAAHRRHVRAGEPPCAACRAAENARQRELRARHGTEQPAGPYELRVAGYDAHADRITFAADMDDAGRYRVEVDLALDAGEVVVDCVRFTPLGDNRALPTARLFRLLRMRDLQTQLAAEVRRPWVLMQVRRTWTEALMAPGRPGRRGTPDAHFAVWAKRYVDALKVEPARPVALMVERELARGPEHRTTAAAIRAKLERARKRGLLTEAPPGRPGGRLTPKANALLAGMPAEEV